MKVALTGAGGFVGGHLRKKFPDFVVISRDDDEEQILQKLEDVDAVFNLAGAPIIKRWSEQYKKILISSRVQSTQKLVNAINKSDVRYLISTSAIGAYPNDAPYDESFEGYGDDFLAKLTQVWEDEAKKCNKPTAIVRFGVVLGSDGGALKQMLTPFKLGVGGVIGDGKMMTSWVDIDDLVGAYEYLLEHRLTGLFNITAPNPVTNYEFTKTLGRIVHRPTIFGIPNFILKMLFGEGAAVLTDSKEIYPKALQESGYIFKFPEIHSSLQSKIVR
jgi:uncharacterized protein